MSFDFQILQQPESHLHGSYEFFLKGVACLFEYVSLVFCTPKSICAFCVSDDDVADDDILAVESQEQDPSHSRP